VTNRAARLVQPCNDRSNYKHTPRRVLFCTKSELAALFFSSLHQLPNFTNSLIMQLSLFFVASLIASATAAVVDTVKCSFQIPPIFVLLHRFSKNRSCSKSATFWKSSFASKWLWRPISHTRTYHISAGICTSLVVARV